MKNHSKGVFWYSSARPRALTRFAQWLIRPWLRHTNSWFIGWTLSFIQIYFITCTHTGSLPKRVRQELNGIKKRSVLDVKIYVVSKTPRSFRSGLWQETSKLHSTVTTLLIGMDGLAVPRAWGKCKLSSNRTEKRRTSLRSLVCRYL